MLSNSVANNWATPDKTTITGSTSQDYSSSADKPGLLSLLCVADVNIHISKTSPSSTSKFLILANTYFEIPVADLAEFSFWGVSAGNLYVIEWLG